MDNQEPTVGHRGLCYGQPGRGGVWGRGDTCKHVAESLSYSPETATTLLIDYILTQNKGFFNNVCGSSPFGETWTLLRI